MASCHAFAHNCAGLLSAEEQPGKSRTAFLERRRRRFRELCDYIRWAWNLPSLRPPGRRVWPMGKAPSQGIVPPPAPFWSCLPSPYLPAVDKLRLGAALLCALWELGARGGQLVGASRRRLGSYCCLPCGAHHVSQPCDHDAVFGEGYLEPRATSERTGCHGALGPRLAFLLHASHVQAGGVPGRRGADLGRSGQPSQKQRPRFLQRLLWSQKLRGNGIDQGAESGQERAVCPPEIPRAGEKGCRGSREAQAEEAEETPGAFLAGASLRTGAPVQATEVSLGPRERSLGQRAEAHLHPGQNLVPEQKVQMQKAEAGPKPGDGGHPSTQEDSGASPSQGWEAVLGRIVSVQLALQCQPQPLQLQRLPSLQQLQRGRLQRQLQLQLPQYAKRPALSCWQQLHELWHGGLEPSADVHPAREWWPLHVARNPSLVGFPDHRPSLLMEWPASAGGQRDLLRVACKRDLPWLDSEVWKLRAPWTTLGEAVHRDCPGLKGPSEGVLSRRGHRG